MTPAPTERDLIIQREAEAFDHLAEILERLEASGERVRLAQDGYSAVTAERDRLALEAWRDHGLSQELIGQVSGLGIQPAVARAIRRAEKREGERADAG